MPMRLAPLLAVLAAASFSASAAERPADDPVQQRAAAYRLYMEAADLARIGRVEKAQSLLERVLELDPDAARVRSLLARLCLSRGDVMCAETEARRAVELSEEDSEAHEVLADLYRTRYRRSGEKSHFDATVMHLRKAAAAQPDDAMLWVRLIRMLGTEGLYAEAEEEARRAASIPGVDASRPWMALAHALLARGQHGKAIALLEGLDLPGRAAVPLLRMLADLKAGANDVSGQVEVLRRLRVLRPEDPEVVHRLGHALLSLEDPFAALEPLTVALETRPADPTIRRDLARAYVKLGKGGSALEHFAALPEVLHTPNTLRQWAQAAEQAGRHELAAEKLERVADDLEGTDQESLIPSFRLTAARNRLLAGQHGRALDLLEGLGDDVTVLRLRLDALELGGRRGDADQMLAEALARDPDDAGLIACSADRVADAAGDEAALGLLLDEHADAGDPALFVRGVANHLLDWGRAPLAAGFIDAIGLADEPDPGDLLVRAIVLNAAGRVGEAEAAFRRRLELSPDDHVALNELGYLLATEGRSLGEAVRLLERAVELRPQASDYLDSLGWALHRSGRSEEALPWLRRAMREATKDRQVAVIREHLGDVYHALGDPQRALAEWRAAMSFGSTDPQGLLRKIEDLETGPGPR